MGICGGSRQLSRLPSSAVDTAANIATAIFIVSCIHNKIVKNNCRRKKIPLDVISSQCARSALMCKFFALAFKKIMERKTTHTHTHTHTHTKRVAAQADTGRRQILRQFCDGNCRQNTDL